MTISKELFNCYLSLASFLWSSLLFTSFFLLSVTDIGKLVVDVMSTKVKFSHAVNLCVCVCACVHVFVGGDRGEREGKGEKGK